MRPETIMPSPGTARSSRDRRPTGPRRTAATISCQGVAAARFAQSLLHLSRPSIVYLVARLNARRRSPGDDVAWWEATTSLNRALRHRGTSHQAAMAAHQASQAMLAAATRTGLALSPDVLTVARSAGEVARVLVAGDTNATGAGYLTRGWEDLLLPPADSPTPSGPAGGGGGQAP
jgi:hypothetical protein